MRFGERSVGQSLPIGLVVGDRMFSQLTHLNVRSGDIYLKAAR